ncbi:hypothetical protein A3A40_00835 [Candidatus Kaiserbacteria bacterium RIFCSPLOWO2_01_FULL_54_20]|uniref:GtrA/DPMS transmembrane domain-containing protein n=1 Tax=Candidatus Kaiserbacteria bacterium RIFCSPLOWO2_01_FULL_54_20 TaxID=1798513 RepID=A0A1F6EIM1_9BACT|nr:MAG: hypothetical protein A3A40_00835 [Candidatus Kaiserbacteria bacterium RIFCSPLOWO2_01_FULL_54_20]
MAVWIHPVVQQFLRFGIVGFVATVAYYAVLFFCIEALRVAYLKAAIFGLVAALTVHLVLQRTWTFEKYEHERRLREQGLLVVKQILLFLLNAPAINYAVTEWGWWYLPLQVIALVALIPVSFWLSKLIFRR